MVNRYGRLVAVVTAAGAAMASTPSTASALAAEGKVYQTSLATCRKNLAAPHSVLTIGDSILSRWGAAATAQFTAAGHPICLNAQSGRNTAGAVSELAGYKKAGVLTPNATVVMAIGSNDTYGARTGYMRGQVDKVVHLVGTRQRIVWVDVLNWSLSRGVVGQRAYAHGTWVVNQQLWQKDAQYPNITVAHWNAMIRGNVTKYADDYLHTNAFGNKARNELVIRTLGNPGPRARRRPW